VMRECLIVLVDRLLFVPLFWLLDRGK